MINFEYTSNKHITILTRVFIFKINAFVHSPILNWQVFNEQ